MAAAPRAGAPSRRGGRPFAIAAAGSVALIGLSVAWYLTQAGGEVATQAFGDLVTTVAPGWGALCCVVAARGEAGRARRGWALLGCMCASWAAGNVVWTWFELVAHREVPFPSLADVGYLGAIPLGVAAVLAFPTAPRRTATSVRVLLDGAIIAASLLFVSWATVLGPAYRGAEGTLAETVIGLAYPAGDLVIAMIVLVVAGRARAGGRVPLGLLIAGLLSLAVADSGFAWLTSMDLYGTAGSLIDLGWVGGFLLIGLAALRPAKVVRKRERASLRGTVLPTLAVGAAVGVAGVRQAAGTELGPFLFWTAAALLVMLVARQYLALVDNVRLNRDLEARVRARTAELRAALGLASEAQRLQGQFVANASHELRTPLTVIVGSTATLLRDDVALDARTRMLAEMAYAGSLRMQRLVEDLLVVSGLSDDLAPAQDRIPLAPLVEQAAGAFRRELRTVVDPAIALKGDVEHVRAVLGHLLSNAEKFAPEGTAVRIDARTLGGTVAIAVHDEGAPIPAELHERIFDRFFQADGSSTREHGGAGLGLFIARSLARAMGGDLRLETSERGNTFLLHLPAAPALAGAAVAS